MSSPASPDDAGWLEIQFPPPPYGGCSCHAMTPPLLDDLDDDAMVAVAATPGKTIEEWRHVALGVWVAWPDAAVAFHAEVMTAGQLRALLAERDHG